jgi:hypothetical protein
MAFVQQVEVSSAAAPGSVTTGSITTTAGNLLVMVIQFDDVQTPVITTSQANSFVRIVGATADTGAGARVKLQTYYATANGGATTFTLTVGGTGMALYVAEYSGGTIYVNGAGNGAFQNGPGSGANTIVTGNVGAAGPVLLFAFSCCAQLNVASTAGTIPLAFTGRTTVWGTRGSGTAIGTPEDISITGNGGGTFGITGGGAAELWVSVAAAFSTNASGAAPPTPFTPTQFFVTDTIIQQ